jgi:tetratricopeptide (TPR) repeat protein
MNTGKILLFTMISMFLTACGLNVGGSSESNNSAPNTQNNVRNINSDNNRDSELRRENDYERAFDEIRGDIHHLFKRMDDLNRRLDEIDHGMFTMVPDMGSMLNNMPPMGNIGGPQMNRPNNMDRGFRDNPNSKEITMEQRYDRGARAYKGKNYQEVISLFSGIINGTNFDTSVFGSTSKKVYLYRGLAYYEQQLFTEALEDLTTYIDSNSTEDICLSEAHKGRSLIYLGTGEETKATDEFSKATVLSSGIAKNPCLLY